MFRYRQARCSEPARSRIVNGAVSFEPEDAAMDAIPDNRQRFAHALGEAVVNLWGDLPQDIQQHLFEAAVRTQGEQIRPQLAEFLHDHHPRTEATMKARAMVEPDSLGG
jgi:hypothetical protein